MLFWSNNRTAPSEESRSDARAFSRRSERSFAKSILCSQSTAIVAPREAMFIVGILPRLQWSWGSLCSSLTNKSILVTKRLPGTFPHRKRRSYKGKGQNPSPRDDESRLTKLLTDQYL